MTPDVRYYLSHTGTLYRKRGQQIDLYSPWATTAWVPLVLPPRHIGPWRRVSVLRAWIVRAIQSVHHRRYERAVRVR